MFKKCRLCEDICGKIWYWAMVIYWTRFWKEVVFFREQSTRSLGQHCGTDVAGICRKWTPYFPCNDSIVQGSAQKQRARKAVDTLHCRSRHNWYNLSHYSFCQSAQCLRSSAKNLRTIKIERENLWYWCDNQLFLAKSKQKLLCTTKIPWMTKLFGSNTFNKLNRFHQNTEWVAREMGSPMCASTFSVFGVAHAGEEGWINILPWYRLVGVAKTSSETQRRNSRAARKGKWPRGTGTTVLTYPRSAPRGAGKAGENGQNSGEVGGSSAWTRPSAPECGDTLKALAGDQRPIQGGDLDKTVGSRVWRHTQGSSGRPASDPGWGSSSKTAPGSLSTGSPAGRTPPHGDGSIDRTRMERCSPRGAPL